MGIPEHVGHRGELRVLANDVTRGGHGDVSHGTAEGRQHPVGVVHVLGGDGRTREGAPEQTAHALHSSSPGNPLANQAHRIGSQVKQPVDRSRQDSVGTTRRGDVRGDVPTNGHQLTGVGVTVLAPISGAGPGILIGEVTLQCPRRLRTENCPLARVENRSHRSAGSKAGPLEDRCLHPMTSLHIVQVAVLMLYIRERTVSNLGHLGQCRVGIVVDDAKQSPGRGHRLLGRSVGDLVAEVGNGLGLGRNIPTARGHRHDSPRVLLEFRCRLDGGGDVGRQVGLRHPTYCGHGGSSPRSDRTA